VENPFVIKENSDNTISVFLCDPDEIGAESEHVMTLSNFWLKMITEKLQDHIKENNHV
jgi:hypothetical protein